MLCCRSVAGHVSRQFKDPNKADSALDSRLVDISLEKERQSRGAMAKKSRTSKGKKAAPPMREMPSVMKQAVTAPHRHPFHDDTFRSLLPGG